MLSIQSKLLRLIYTLGFYVLVPFILCRLWLRGIKQPDYRARWKERFGHIQFPPYLQPCILIHCVSVGETRAAEPLINLLQSELPNYHLHITTMTTTGSKTVRSIWGDNITHSYIPYDIPSALRRFLNTIRPQLIIILETEIWPNLLYASHQKKIPVLMSNTRLSSRSMRGYQKLGRAVKDLFNLPTMYATQSTIDATNLQQLGVPKAKISITGSLKFDSSFPPRLVDDAKKSRATWQLSQTPLLIAGSTRPGEEQQILDALSIVKKKYVDTCLLLAPRHPQRFDGVKALCQTSGFSVIESCSISTISPLHFKPDIILINTMGQLPFYYAMADICFVGGSLVDLGCHNVLEPAMLGKPIITGTSTYNFKQICEWLVSANGLQKVNDSKALAKAWLMLIQDPVLSTKIGATAKHVVDSHKGATHANLQLIKKYLER